MSWFIGQGKCGVAVIRITGKDAKYAITNMTKPSNVPKPKTAVLRSIIHAESGKF